MFHDFRFRRNDFLATSHKRSNAESVFPMGERKFGDSLRSKTRPAVGNELWCKILAPDSGVLIREQEELGIVPVFWPDDSGEEPATLKFPAARMGYEQTTRPETERRFKTGFRSRADRHPPGR